MHLEQQFDHGKQLLQSLGYDRVSHSRRTLLDHLTATGKILRNWGCPATTCLAGLFHSVYGTEGFRSRTAPVVEREIIQNAIGLPAERTAWLFGMSTSQSLWDQFRRCRASGNDPSHFLLANRISGEELSCTQSELVALMQITLANALDQAQHLPERYDEKKLLTFRFLLPCVPQGGVLDFEKMLHQRSSAPEAVLPSSACAT
jgi:uncharacterized protein DUF6817